MTDDNQPLEPAEADEPDTEAQQVDVAADDGDYKDVDPEDALK